jgi:hypothetical protein
VVTAAPPEVAANSWVPVELEDRVIVVAVALVEGLPNTSTTPTVKEVVAEALAPALKVLMPSLVPGSAVIVAVWVAEVRPVAAAVMVGVPALVSP